MQCLQKALVREVFFEQGVCIIFTPTPYETFSLDPVEPVVKIASLATFPLFI
jgi:hypothetical protein